MVLRKIKIKYSGFSLIEVLVVVFIAAVVFTSFYTVSTVGTKYIIESKNRLGAVAFANEKMEIIRNLEYDKVGIQGSIDIPGNLKQEDDAVSNGRTYHISTSVRYFDDPLDGTISTSPADLIPNDYKLVRVIVSWNDSNGQAQSVSSSSRFVPPGLETSTGGSPLSINVTDENSLLPVAQASVHITNNTTSPVINDTIQTNNSGHILFPAAKISLASHISITKSGYETLSTMDSSATFMPKYGHVNVIAGFLNTYNFFLSKLYTLTVKSVDMQNNPVGSIGFSIGGGKIIGHDTLLNVDVFSLPSESGTTDAVSGQKVYPDMIMGNYNVAMSPNVQYELIKKENVMNGGNSEHILRVADKNINALFLKVENDDASPTPLAGAKVTLSDGGVDIFSEKLSATDGIVFYPDVAATLENKNYTLKVEADGYISSNQTITIDKLTPILVNLVKS